jgi:hypothetical protein
VANSPFLEATDVIVGFSVIKTPDLHTALALARHKPILGQGGGLEVRRVAQSNVVTRPPAGERADCGQAVRRRGPLAPGGSFRTPIVAGPGVPCHLEQEGQRPSHVARDLRDGVSTQLACRRVGGLHRAALSRRTRRPAR